VTRAFVGAVARGTEAGAEPPRGLRRRIILTTIFRAMPRQLDRRRAKKVDAVVEWRIADGEGGVDIWTTTIRDGRCRVRRGGAEKPRTRIETGTGEFLALVTGNASGPSLWMNGHLRIEGDVMFAGALASMFRAPRGRSS
jgi:hypothetical protein